MANVYVYAVAAADHPLSLEGATGVGAEPAPLRVVTAGPVSAVVSDAPADLRAKRRDLDAHQKVLEALGGQGTVLPMRFGSLAENDDAVREQLERRGEEYAERLRALEGKVEFNVRADQDEDTVLRLVLDSNEEVRRLSRSGVGATGTLDQRIALGEAVAADVQARQEETGGRIAYALSAIAVQTSRTQAAGETFLNISFLVERTRAKEFAEQTQRLADQYRDEGVRLRLYGPLPPYSFV